VGLPQSALYLAVEAVAERVDALFREAKLIDTDIDDVTVVVGTPHDAEKVWKDNDGEHQVNVFAYRIEPFEFQTDLGPGDVHRFRVHLLIAVRAEAETGPPPVTAGENAIRLLGSVVRAFQDQPVLPPPPALPSGAEWFYPRVVLESLGVDELNHLWSVQGDAIARPAVAYEIGLVPVLPTTAATPAPRVGTAIQEVRADITAVSDAPTRNGTSRPEAAVTVDWTEEDWAPYICFVHAGACHEHLAFQVPAPVPDPLTVWIAGKPGTSVAVTWQVWTKTDGWTDEPVGGADPVVQSDTVDPHQVALDKTVPVIRPAPSGNAQLVLFATRSYTRTALGGEETVEVRSNPIFVNIWGAA